MSEVTDETVRGTTDTGEPVFQQDASQPDVLTGEAGHPEADVDLLQAAPGATADNDTHSPDLVDESPRDTE